MIRSSQPKINHTRGTRVTIIKTVSDVRCVSTVVNRLTTSYSCRSIQKWHTKLKFIVLGPQFTVCYLKCVLSGTVGQVGKFSNSNTVGHNGSAELVKISDFGVYRVFVTPERTFTVTHS